MFSALHAAVVAPFVVAFLGPSLHRRLGDRSGYAMALVPGALFAYLATFLPRVVAGETVQVHLPWVPLLDIEFSLWLNGFSLLFALLITGIGLLVTCYSAAYLGRKEDLGKFYLYLLLFLGAMLGLVLSSNLLTLYVFWELTSVSSFLLIGFWHPRGEARDGALKALLITMVGELALLSGLVLIYLVTGTFELSALAGRAADLAGHPSYPWIVLCVLLGAFTKSAQLPFYIWLPSAMAAPTPISAYLHSATMVKVGLFLVATLTPVLGGTGLWVGAVSGAGILTMVAGAWLAVSQRDLKGLLALSTVSQLGLIMAALGLGSEAALAAGVLHILTHASFKGSLFMVAGIIDHETGTRDVTRLAGLARFMPVTAALAAVSSLSMAGVPPFGGFVSKELILDAFVHGPAGLGAWLAAAAAVGSAFTAVYSMILGHRLFFGRGALDTPKKPHEAPAAMWIPAALLAGVAVVVGLWPASAEGLVTAAAGAVATGPVDLHLALWHGLNLPLLLSAGALLAGLLLYLQLPGLWALLGRLQARYHLNALYEWSLGALDRVARSVTDAHMTGRLRDYVVFITGAAVLLVGGTLLGAAARLAPALDLAPVGPLEAVASLTTATGAVALVLARSRVAAILSLTTVGLSSAILFLLWQAPDLALTQVVVEAVTLFPLLLALSRLPRLRREPPSGRGGVVNLGVAAAGGILVSALTLYANGLRQFPPISDFYLEASRPLAGGGNVVNVILVDFRGLDTLGEITVLAVAALGVYALVRLGRSRPQDRERGSAAVPEQAGKEAGAA